MTSELDSFNSIILVASYVSFTQRWSPRLLSTIRFEDRRFRDVDLDVIHSALLTFVEIYIL